MCNFFSAIVFRTGEVRFCEFDAHDILIGRLNLNDTADLFLRGWVRVEVRPSAEGGWGPVTVDETSVPGWYDESRAIIEARVLALAERVRLARAAYDAAVQSAQAVYNAAEQAAWAVYDAAVQAARAVYNAAVQAARAVYLDAIPSIEGYVPAS